MKFRFEQKVIYRDLDPFVIISLWVFAVSLQFSYAIKWDHNICHGGRRGRRKRLQSRGKLKEVWCTKEKHIQNSLYPSIGTTKYFKDYWTLAFTESVSSSWKALFAFRLLSSNIHKYLWNRPKWLHNERWHGTSKQGQRRTFRQWKTK